MEKAEIKYPLIIKPRWGMGSIAVYEAKSDEELRVLFKKTHDDIFESYLKYESVIDAGNCVLIQQKIDGQEYGVDNICDLAGNYVTTIIRKKIGMRAGETDCAEIVDNPQLRAMAERLAQLTKHIAIMDIDVMVSQGVPYILEMNARFGGGYPFSHAAGVNLPKAIVAWLRKQLVDPVLFCPNIGVIAQKDIGILTLRRQNSSDEPFSVDLHPLEEPMIPAIAKFIKEEIDPFLSIALNQKMTLGIDDYAKKIVQKANGYVALKNGKIVGLVAAYLDNRIEEDRAFLTIFGVEHNVRNKGIGTMLLCKIANDVPDGCILYTTVDAQNEIAWRVYKKAGFHEQDIDNGRKLIEMNPSRLPIMSGAG